MNLLNYYDKTLANMPPINSQNRNATKKIPQWVTTLGAVFGGLTLLFFMAIVLLGIAGIDIPNTVRFPLSVVFSLGCGLSASFLGGTAVTQGKIQIPGIQKYPITFTITGGAAITVVILGLCYWFYVKPGARLTVQDLFSSVESDANSNATRVKAFSQLTSQYGWQDFKGRHLSQLALPLSSIDEGDFTEANMFHCSLQGQRLRKMTFVRANLSESDLEKCDFRESELNGAILNDADCSGAVFDSVILRAGQYIRTNFRRASLRQSNLQAADFSGAHFEFAHLEGADFDDPSTYESELKGANFSNSFLEAVDFRNTLDLNTCQFTGARYNEYTSFPPGFNPASFGMRKD